MENNITRFTFPAYFVNHPSIGHQRMIEKIFPYLKPERLSFDNYIRYHQACYLVLCQNFDEYEAYLEEEYWKEFKNKKRIKYDRV